MHILSCVVKSIFDEEGAKYAFDSLEAIRKVKLAVDDKEHKFHKALSQFALGNHLLSAIDTFMIQVKKDEYASPQLKILFAFVGTATKHQHKLRLALDERKKVRSGENKSTARIN